MIELVRTRERIVRELSNYPSSHIDQTFSHIQPWHSPKIASLEQGLHTFKSQTLQLPRLIDRRNSAKPRRRNQPRQQGRVSHSASTVFVSKLHTGLTMAPIMATSGDFISELGMGGKKSGKDKMRLPIFRLPAIDVVQFSAEKQRSEFSSTLETTNGIRNSRNFVSYTDGKGFRHAMSLTLRALSPKERGFLLQNLRVTEADLVDVLEQLDRTPDKKAIGAAPMSTGDFRVGSADASFSGLAPRGERAKLGEASQRRAVFALGTFFAVDSSPAGSCFMKARDGNSAGGHDLRQLLSSGGEALANGANLFPPAAPGLSADLHRFIALRSTTGSVSALGTRLRQPSNGTVLGSTSQQFPLIARSSLRNAATGPSRAHGGGTINREETDSRELTHALIESLREMDKHSKMVPPYTCSCLCLLAHRSRLSPDQEGH